jgi:peptidoglycan hydrolase-like protein with peptidoglycan-binding domain
MTGADVKEIQTILHKQGFGDIVGSVDGKLGPKTLAGIKQLFLGVTRPKIEAITNLKPKGIEPLTTKPEPSPQLAEEIQKNFKRFL